MGTQRESWSRALDLRLCDAHLFCFRIGDDVFSETEAEQVGFFVVHKKVTIFSENGLAKKEDLEHNNK